MTCYTFSAMHIPKFKAHRLTPLVYCPTPGQEHTVGILATSSCVLTSDGDLYHLVHPFFRFSTGCLHVFLQFWEILSYYLFKSRKSFHYPFLFCL